MNINVQCPKCSRTYPVKPEFAGKKLRCKECQTVLTVPSTAAPREKSESQPRRSEAPSQGAPRKDASRRESPQNPKSGDEVARRETPRKAAPKRKVADDDFDDVEIVKNSDEELDDVDVVEDDDHDHAEGPPHGRRRRASQHGRRRARSSLPTLSMPAVPLPSGDSVQNILVAISFLAVVAWMALLTIRYGFHPLPMMVLSGYAISVPCGFSIMITAFREKLVYGIAYLLVPCFGLWYVITRWDEVGTYFIGLLGGAAVSFAGLQMIRQARPDLF